MDPVEIRAAAAQAAASYAGRIGEQRPEDIIFAADILTVYITYGSGPALKYIAEVLPAEEEPPAGGTVELRETTPEPPVAATPVTPAPPIPVVPAPEPPIADKSPELDNPVRRKIEAGRRQKAESFLAQAKVAKAEGHKQKLIRDVEASGLSDFVLTIDNRPQKLGLYLASL